MPEELNKKINPVHIKSEERDARRFPEWRNMVLAFYPYIAKGQLVNISIGGALGKFPGSAPLPEMSQKVVVKLEIGNKNNILEIDGSVIRIQPAGIPDSQGHVELAIKFTHLSPEQKQGIRNIINALMGKAMVSPYLKR